MKFVILAKTEIMTNQKLQVQKLMLSELTVPKTILTFPTVRGRLNRVLATSRGVALRLLHFKLGFKTMPTVKTTQIDSQVSEPHLLIPHI